METKLKKETIEARERLIDEGADEGAIDAYIALGIGDDDLSNFDEAYVGQFDSDEDFAQDMAENTGSVDFKNQPWPQYCIDWEYAARDLMMDYNEQDGYYFRQL